MNLPADKSYRTEPSHPTGALQPSQRALSVAAVLMFLLSLSRAGPVAAQPSLDEATGPWVELKGGLRYVDIEVGEGEGARPGNHVQVHYTGYLEDGTRFQSSHDTGRSFGFVLGQGQVIVGWDRGVRGMKPGGKRRLEIPFKLAYGRRGRLGIIPPKANLIFDVELVSISITRR